MTFTVGTWAIPTILTIGVWAWALCHRPERGHYFPDIFTPLFYGAIAATTSLGSWLIWALFLRGES